MTDETEANGEDQPVEDAHIRALLAELGSGPDGESMPPEVSARLDDTLARLVAERAGAGSDGPESDGPGSDEPASGEAAGNVVPLRRRWGSRLTAAAAAVVVLGAGGVAAANLGVFGGASGDSATSSDAGGGSAAKSEALAPSPSTPEGASRQGIVQAESLPRVRSARFAADAGRLVATRQPSVTVPAPAAAGAEADDKAGDKAGGSQDSGGDSSAARRPAAELRALSCPGPEITDGAVPNPIVYDGRVAVLVVHPESAGKQLVEAWSCEGDQRLDSATITP